MQALLKVGAVGAIKLEIVIKISAFWWSKCILYLCSDVFSHHKMVRITSGSLTVDTLIF